MPRRIHPSGVLPALLLFSLAATGAVSTGPDDTGPAEPGPVLTAPGDVEGWRFAAIPMVSYGSDVGLTLGAGIFFYRPIPGHPGEHQEASLSLSYATRGPRSADLGWGLRRIFGTPLRTRWNFHLADDALMPYWGEGAQLGGLATPAGFGTPPAPFRYHDRRFFATAILQGPIAGPFGWHLRARWLTVDVAEPSALLVASQPPGLRGGRVAVGEVGLLYDTRDREVGTRRGWFVTAAGFVAPQLDGVSDFAFHGYDAAVRVYVPLVLGMTLAGRALYDRKIAGVPTGEARNAAVPFFERMMYEGISYNEGLGGAATIRGIARYRVAGDEKMLANVQLRMHLLTTRIASKTQEWGLSLGLDAGRASQPGYPAIEAAGATAGLRFIWDRALLFRVEVGRARGGENTLYIAFGEQF
jgi:hypothetical protein